MTDEVPEATDDEVSAIFARLHHEVHDRPAAGRGCRTKPVLRAPLPSRALAQRTWAVTAERPIEHQLDRRMRRYFTEPVKRVLRKLMRWYVEPLAAQQRSFNLAILAVVDELAERFEDDLTRLERRLQELDDQRGAAPPEPSE
jgi:hypothetical protein